ncbi:acyltransferase [Clostridium butyricum]|uniref:acyltransferase n=1 Tax=Clostridium butyricum TaxID=1492 RepID=UPI003D3539B7
MRYIMCYLMKILKRIISILKIITWKVFYFNGIKFGNNTVFYPGCRITVEPKGKIVIGKNCFFNHHCSLTSLKNIYIGDDCIFGENVKIYDHNHNINKKSIIFRKQGYSVAPTIIGNNCWIGSNVTILPGVCVGNNVVIGAGSIITKNISDNTILIQKKINFEKLI